VRYYGERTGTAGSDRGLAEQIARYLAAVRASGWGWRFEALQPNENPVWTFALVIHQLCDQGDLDGATARLAEAEALGPTWARVGVIDALMRKIPDAIGTPRAQPEDASAPCGQGEPIPAVWKALIEAVRREGLVLSLLQNAPAAGTDWNAGILRLLELWRRELPDLAPPEIPRARTYQEVQAAVDVFLRAIEAAARTPSAVPLPVVGVVQAASGPAKVEQP
jgi:hypothetical protein